MQDIMVLTPKECAKLLKVGMNTMYDLLNREDFPAIKVGANWRINAARLQDWLDYMVEEGD